MDRQPLDDQRLVDPQHIDAIAPPDAAAVVDRMIDNLADAEFSIPGHLVIDVCVEGRTMAMRDGGIAIDITALTIRDSD